MSIAKRVVHLCYVLDDFTPYKRLKSRCYDLLENPHSRSKPYFDLAMILLVLSSVAVLIYEVKHELGRPAAVFEACALVAFIVEYLLRMWVYNDSHRIVVEEFERAELVDQPFRLRTALWQVLRRKWEYMTTPLAVIDLLAILPSFRSVRILRLFLLARMFKLFRYGRNVNEFARVLQEKRFELYTLALVVLFLILASSAAIYLLEGGAPGGNINSFFDAIYWALVTVSTVGYGDIAPHTVEGRIVAIVLIVSGIGVLAFSTSIIVSAFTEKLRELREHRFFADVERLRDFVLVCGYGRVGEVVAKKLAADGEHVAVIEKDEEAAERAKRHGFLAIQGDAAQGELLERVGIRDRVRVVLCVTGDDVINVFITLSARYLNGDVAIISRANRTDTAIKLSRAGATHVVTPYQVVALAAAEYVGQPVAFEAIYGILSGDQGLAIEALVVAEGSFLENTTVGAANLLKHRLVLFGVMTARSEGAEAESGMVEFSGRRFYFNPTANFVLRARDILVVFGHRLNVQHFKESLDKSVLRRRRG